MFSDIEYLWEIDISRIPFGDLVSIKDAEENFPNGQKVTYPVMEWNNNYTEQILIEKENFYDPIGYRKKLIELFNHFSNEAKEINSAHLSFKNKLNELVRLDVLLFNILNDYLSEPESRDISVYNPNKLEINSLSEYVDDDRYLNDAMKEVFKLKLLNLDF